LTNYHNSGAAPAENHDGSSNGCHDEGSNGYYDEGSNGCHDGSPDGYVAKSPGAGPAAYKMLEIDPWLNPYQSDINARMDLYYKTKNALTNNGARRISEVVNNHLYFGFHRADNGRDWVYREWAPAADAIFLVGDFNYWDANADPLEKLPGGVWEITLSGQKAEGLRHTSRVKARVVSRGRAVDRIPLYIGSVVRDPNNGDFSGRIWDPPERFVWGDGEWMGRGEDAFFIPLIYEAHIGMAQNKEGIGTYGEFEGNILPRVKKTGYNAIQLMAIAEHPYYASFGYQVSNFFAPSQWFGDPDGLKSLVDAAHRMGLAVYMDLVHSHAVMNFFEGINEFDGTVEQFFHAGGRGNHSAWGTKLFNYGKYEVIHYLLSNIKYWLDEFHFDGFRFDGVTSMIYQDHGLGSAFDNYSKYYSLNTDFEALVYLQLANEMIHELRPGAVTIAEDMSGMPGMCLPIPYGGIGFDYRLSMGVPDFWIRTLKTLSDEQLSIGGLWHELTTRRPGERNIAYCESHDQALVGDKTLIFWLADKEMYDGMSVFSENLIVDRAVAIHKMIRFISMALAGEGYLNFIGNEFGHPEWIDFPRLENGWSYKYAKRRWDLADRDDLHYKHLLAFDREMLKFTKERKIQRALDLMNLWVDEQGKLLAFRKAGLVFLFNFSPGHSFEGFELPLSYGGYFSARYKVVFDSDRPEFGGQGRISESTVYETYNLRYREGGCGLALYIPARTFLVLAEV